MSSNPSKIAFGKKTPTVHVQKNAHQMRLVIAQDGAILHANDAFAAHLGIPPLDLRGRNLLDTVLFENFNDLIDDRAVFNRLSSGGNGGVASLREGEHVLILGRNHDRIPFHFDWVRGQDKKRYLVACNLPSPGGTLSQGDLPDWTSIISTLVPSNASMPQPVAKMDQPAMQQSDVARESEADDQIQPKRPQKKAESAKPKKTLQEDILSRNYSLNSADIKRFAEVTNNLLCLIEFDGTLIRYNESFAKKMRMQNEQNLSFLDLIHADDRASVRQYIQSLGSHDAEDNVTDQTMDFETRMKCGNNRHIWMKWHIHKGVKALYCLGTDITSSKISEQALRRREQELSEAQALANMGHWRWRVGSTKIEWSDQIYKIFGVTRDEFTPTLDNTNSLLHKRDIGRMMQAFQRAIIEQNDYDMDFRVVRKDGTIRYIRCEGRCELDEDGDVIALYGVMQDNTEQTEHEMELREAIDAAEQAYAAKSRFLANMSHELRTPLNAIIGFSDMIQRQMLGPLGSDKYVDYATSIKDSGEHLLDLITDILDMSKIEAGKYELDLEKIQLGTVVNTAMRMIESRAQEGVITLESHITTEEPVIVADRRAVMQILLNVLSNAVKFTEPGGKITAMCEEFENHVTVRVTDTGIGIPANKLSAVMRPFEQVSTAFTRNHEGSGLGLAITKELAELHGGMLALESTIGQGTTVSLRLPRDASKKKKAAKNSY